MNASLDSRVAGFDPPNDIPAVGTGVMNGSPLLVSAEAGRYSIFGFWPLTQDCFDP